MSRRLVLALPALLFVAAASGSVLTVLLLGARGAGAQATAVTAGVVTAQELRLTDPQGKVRLRAGVLEDGEVYLNLRDAGEGPRLVLGVPPQGPAALILRDQGGRDRIVIDLEDGVPALTIYDAAEEQRIYLGQGLTSGGAILTMTDQQGRDRIYLGQLTDGSPTLRIYDTANNAVFTAPSPPTTPSAVTQ